MSKKGVKAIFAKDKKTVTTVTYPSKSGEPYKLTKKTWKNSCAFCGSKLKFNPKNTPEGELSCPKCDADFCCVTGRDKGKGKKKLKPATVTPNGTTNVAGSQTQSQKCSLSKAQALTKAKSLLKTAGVFKATIKIPVMKNINTGDMCEVNITGFGRKTLYIDKIKEDIDNQTYTLDLIEGKNHLDNKYEGEYILKNTKGSIINASSKNPLQAKCQTVNINIGLKDKSEIGKKIKLKGQELGTVDKIYKWLKVSTAGGIGGWKYKKYSNHIVKSESVDKFGPKSAKKCWESKRGNCTDLSWIMAKLGEGAGKKIGIKKGTFTKLSGVKSGHMWNYYKTKNYDCSSATTKTIDGKKVEKVK